LGHSIRVNTIDFFETFFLFKFIDVISFIWSEFCFVPDWTNDSGPYNERYKLMIRKWHLYKLKLVLCKPLTFCLDPSSALKISVTIMDFSWSERVFSLNSVPFCAVFNSKTRKLLSFCDHDDIPGVSSIICPTVTIGFLQMKCWVDEQSQLLHWALLTW